MTGLKLSIPCTSSMEPLTVRVFQRVVNKYQREGSKNLSDEGIGDLIHGHTPRALQVPAVWSAYAIPNGDGLESIPSPLLG